jgi:transaldolase/glucose-6-phosphate isomerase
MTKLNQLADLGQAIWLDYIRRSFLETRKLESWIDRGLRGVTSNPSIFDKAIAGSADYDDDLSALVAGTKSEQEIYKSLALEDIRHTADLLRPVYDRTERLDGYVSLEVDPKLADDEAGTVSEIKRFADKLDGYPNVMFKIPATPSGVLAVQAIIAEGLSVNATLIFSVSQYEAIAEAYLSGLEQLDAAGQDLSQVASVASVFVSRVDTAVDRALAERGNATLQGKIAIANAKAIYQRFRAIFAGERWERLTAKGAAVQRVLWASTSVKNPDYPDTLYVDSLIGPHTVNTVPLATLNAFLDHGTVRSTLQDGNPAQILQQLAAEGIELDAITDQLQRDGVKAFIKASENLLKSITEKREQLLSHWRQISLSLGPCQPSADTALTQLVDKDVVARLWAHDYTLWADKPTEITNRMGWLHIADFMLDNVDCLQAFADDVHTQKYTHVVLLGMGGSSLAADVFRKTFVGEPGGLDLVVLDSTDPAAVSSLADSLPLDKTLFIVATKAGTTAETIAFFQYFYNRLLDLPDVDEQQAGQQFVAITDPGTQLAQRADDYNFLATFINDPNIGGRYSVLSYFGLVPAVLLGVDLETLLNRALAEASNCELSDCTAGELNRGALLGIVMSTLARTGRDKLTLIASPAIASFGDWVEQLIAESTGKEGTGILPIVGEPLDSLDLYGCDRLFVHLRLDGDDSQDQAVSALERAGHPVVRLHLRDLYDLGRQFFEWEMATAVACYGLKVNPFDQPNVESAKESARAMEKAYKERGSLPARSPARLDAQALHAFLQDAGPADYIAIQAFIQPTPETDVALQALRTKLRARYRLATTVGYGPRFLHSTGQLHKGDAGNGFFIQFTADHPSDIPIPDQPGAPKSSMPFGVFIDAQAQGDAQALQKEKRRLIHFHLGTDVVGAINKLI